MPLSDRELREIVINQQKLLQEMHTAILGNESLGVKGMVKVQQEHSHYISKDKKYKLIAAGAIGGANVGAWVYIKEYFKAKFGL